jgi:hypothetical protein
MSLDDPMGGIFERLGQPGTYKEAAQQYRRESFQVACVKRILAWAFPGRQTVKFVKLAEVESATGVPDFNWFHHHFQSFPVMLAGVNITGANWHLSNLWGNKFAKHPIYQAYHEAAEVANVDLDKEGFALLTRCTNFDGTAVLAMHNLRVAVDTTKCVEEHGIGNKHNTRIVRIYRNRLYCIEDMLSMLELIGRDWASE